MPGPVHAKEVAAGLQFAINIEDAPALTVEGEAVNVHVGAAVGDVDSVLPLQVTVRLPLASAL